MNISRIALASLILFGVLGGASLTASASHNHYQRIIWNKPMSHQKVALKNGRGIIWNKPFKTAKNSKITYRLSHKKGLVLTTVRHMKIKNGNIYYFVKAGKISGWINKNSVKLVKNGIATPTDQTTGATFVQPTGSVQNIVHYEDTTNNQVSAKPSQNAPSSTNNSTSITSVSHYPTTSSSQTSLPTTDPFSTYTTGRIVEVPVKPGKKAPRPLNVKQGAVVYEKVWRDGNLVANNISSTITVGTPIKVALCDESPATQLLVRTLDGKVSGYVDRSQISLGRLTKDELTAATPKTPTKPTTETPVKSNLAQ